MLRKALVIAAAAGLVLSLSAPAFAATEGKHPEAPKGGWSFAGPFGKFDQKELQRGYQVYHEVCSQCHSMNLLSFRNLGEKGGPFYDPEFKDPNKNPYVKAVAADAHNVPDIDGDTGDAIKRDGTPADHFPAPFANEIAAKASVKAVPPDLSVIVKARHGGADYVYSILTGYEEPPVGLKMSETSHYNPYMPGDMTPFWDAKKGKAPEGGFIAMPPPLTVNKVTFADGTPATIENEAKAVSAFLAWASEPSQTARKQMGLMVIIYLLLLTGLVYASYRRVWRNESH